ncbi:MAG: M23 family metallopeptidase [Prevotellaceae bacterium]|jgi:murein DD-endopeptidase MepM/ murein hydrolase activator NlpD|nr:M23 family metallopeptidase [Prevotellaceae bacterium]
MFRKKRYRYNQKTLAYELHRTSVKTLFSRGFGIFLCTVVASVGYFWFYCDYLKLDTPKMLELKRENADLLAKLDVMNHQMEKTDYRLERLRQRDDNVYRPIFGLDRVADEERNAGFGGADRYSHLEHTKNSGFLTLMAKRFDQLSKKAVVQSYSFDEVGIQAEQTDKMASSVPAILPVNIREAGFRKSSSFGPRRDPVYGDIRFHDGIDITGPYGAPIRATGDGVVAKRDYGYNGYGNFVIIDHGFGYKTRYAHLTNDVPVREGQKVSRGEVIGYLGSTGKSIGPHVHYEVYHRNAHVNPDNYYSENIASDEYNFMINTVRGK